MAVSYFSYAIFAYNFSNLFARCKEIHGWLPIPIDKLNEKYNSDFYDGPSPETRRPITLEDFPLTSENGVEVPIFDINSHRIPRRKIIVNRSNSESICGVLVDLRNIQALFNPKPNMHIYDDGASTSSDSPSYHQDSHFIHVDAYPLGFLKTAGNIQANGIPNCFYSILTKINKDVRKNHPVQANSSYPASNNSDKDSSEDNSDSDDNTSTTPSLQQVVKPVSSQFYNYVTHRVASRSGRHDSQQGTVTAAISGAFAKTPAEQLTASIQQSYCAQSLPSERYHQKISIEDCPVACRAEFVYSIDVRALKNPSGRYSSILFLNVFKF